MNILLVNTVPTEQNGITGVIFNYLRAMDFDEITLDFLSINTPEAMYRKVIENKGGTLYILSRFNGILAYWKELYSLVKANKYDAIHVHGNSHTLILELSAAWAAGCKVRIVHSHNTTCKYLSVHKFMTPVFNMLYTHALACGEAAGRWMFGTNPFALSIMV